MKKLITMALMALITMGTSVSAKEWKKIRVGVEGAYPPFSAVAPDGTLEGFDIDIPYALFEEIGPLKNASVASTDGVGKGFGFVKL